MKNALATTSLVLNAAFICLLAAVLIGLMLVDYEHAFNPPIFSSRQNDILRHTYGLIGKYQQRPNDYLGEKYY
jgi:hypothetical protein